MRFDLTVDLDDDRIAWKPLHEALEELDAAGFFPHRFHDIPEQQLARVDWDLSPTLGVRLAGGGGWLIEDRRAGNTPVLAGCAGYRGIGELGIAGPFLFEGDLGAHRAAIVLGTLFSLRERGYRHARFSNVERSAFSDLSAMFPGAIVTEQTSVVRARPRVVVCASGSGSNFQAVVDAVASGRLDFDIVHLFVNRSKAFALERAARCGVPATATIWNRAEEDRGAFDDRVLRLVSAEQPDLVLLLGWMHLLPPSFTAAFAELFNIHPAYLPFVPDADVVTMPDGTRQPAFRGAHAVDDAIAAGAAWIGASMHRVTDLTDRGGILARAPLDRRVDETRDELDMRLHALEHRVVVDALHAWIREH